VVRDVLTPGADTETELSVELVKIVVVLSDPCSITDSYLIILPQ